MTVDMEETETAPWWHKFAIPLACAIIGCGLLGVALDYTNQQREEATQQASKQAQKDRDKAAHALALKQYYADIAACERGNTLRRNINDYVQTQVDFLNTARTARERALKVSATDADKTLNAEAVKAYTILITHSHKTPIVKCEAVYPKP